MVSGLEVVGLLPRLGKLYLDTIASPAKRF